MKTTSLLIICIFSFSFTNIIAQSPELIFEVHFDETLTSTAGEDPFLTSGLSFEPGVFGSGVLMDTGDVLQYAIAGNISSLEGSLSIWVRPNWNPGEVLYRIFVLGKDPRNFEVHMDEGKNLAFAVNTWQLEGNPIQVAFANGENWQQGNWYFLTYTWNSEAAKIFVNGVKVGETTVGFDIPLVTEESFHIGSLDGEQAFMGLMDELKIYDGPLSEEEVQINYEQDLENLPLANALSVIDIFGRNITDDGITLLDWEGPISNPAFKFYFKGNDSLVYPIEVMLSSEVERSYFNLPSTISQNGPTKNITLSSEQAMDSILFAIYQDKNFEEEQFNLNLQYIQNGILSRQIILVKVIDQDYDRPLSYPVIVDFSEVVDPFLLDPDVQEVVTEAAEDWLYYVDGEGIDSIGAGESNLMIGGQDHNFEEKTVSNPIPYKGYYLYAYENTSQGPCVCSTGFPNLNFLQTRNGEVVPIPRIGGLHLNQYGQAFESTPTGWEVVSSDEQWTFEGFFGTDLYSLAKHEIGHAMVFEELPLFNDAQNALGITSPAIAAYYPDTIIPLFPESLSHLFQVLDPASLTTPYGGGVEDPVMAYGREMYTKLDLLIMEAVGYPIRENEVTRALSLTHELPLNGFINQTFAGQLMAQGGIPVYHFEIEEGELPSGLLLDEFTGEITGIAETEGVFPITFFVQDYDERSSGVSLESVINIFGEGSSLAELISFNIGDQVGESQIDQSEKTVLIIMPEGTDVTALSPMISISAGATISPGNGEAQDFSQAVEYTIISENGAVQNMWTVEVEEELSSQAELISFNIGDQVGESQIDQSEKTVLIIMPEGTDVTALSPMISISAGATISPGNGEAQDFSQAVEYTITSENGAVQNTWTVEVEEELSSQAELISFNIGDQVGESQIDQSEKTVLITMPEGTDVTALSPMISISAGATISPGNGEAQDFSQAVEYTITSENGAVQNTWMVEVEEEEANSINDQQVRTFSFYPNPIKDEIWIECLFTRRLNTSIVIIHPNGQVIKKQALGNIQLWNQWVDLSDLNPGVYFIQIIGDDESLVLQKIVKK